MSETLAHRMKERSSGVKITPLAAGKSIPVPGRSVSAGKENSRPTSRIRAATQKPHIQLIARIDKSATAALDDAHADPRARRSTSSVPRGRSSSPSEFTMIFSDFRKKPSRVSLGPPHKKVDHFNSTWKSDEKYNLGLVKNVGICDKLEKGSVGNEKLESRLVKCSENEMDFSSIPVKKPDIEKRVSGDLEKKRQISDELKGDSQETGKAKTRTQSVCNMRKGQSRSISAERRKPGKFNGQSSLETSANNKPGRENVRSSGSGFSLRASNLENKTSTFSRENSINKYPSKLHEKLAFLEGKVKRIASDIKKTKDMLDMNNPDGSKMILSDIQEKISGIEKAMGQVVGNDGDAESSLLKSATGLEEEIKEVMDTKSLVRGLDVRELEARLFPHDKLIRDRTLSKAASGSSETHELTVDISSIKLDMGEKVSFLSEEESKVSAETTNVQEMDAVTTSIAEKSSLNLLNGKGNLDSLLMTDENLNDFDEQERLPSMIIDEEEVEESCINQLNDIGGKTSTGGWFVSEGESVLLAHDDGSCSFYDIANSEEKAQYKPPTPVSPNIWRDCWIVRAPSADGCAGKYVIAASAGNSVDSGYCSWDFYTKEVRAFNFQDEPSQTRTALGPLSNNTMHRRNTLSSSMASENRQWWYKPCGVLIASTATSQKMVQIFDIRDGDNVMKWELQKPVVAMDHASPLHWRNRGKIVLAESDNISLWDVSSLSSQALLSVSSSGRKISALHVNNTDAESGGGVRQRISSSEAEGNDGVFCTPDSINVLDFRLPAGVCLKIPKVGVHAQSVFSYGDSIYIGCTNLRSTGKKYSSQIQQFSLRKQKLLSSYSIPESNAHSHFTSLTQVWGNSDYVMGVCGLGLFVFDRLKDDDVVASFAMGLGNVRSAKDVIGPDDMYFPSFDYMGSRVLVISRDRPALWRYL